MILKSRLWRLVALAAVALPFTAAMTPRLARAAEPAAPDRRDVKSRFAKLDRTRVHYLDAGRRGGEALVFVHGWTCNGDFWRMQVPAFAPGTRVLAVDLPGHGRSDKPENVSYTMDLFARAVESVMRDAKVKRAVLVGHSMGTPVIRQFYRKYPEKTLALVIVDGSLRPFVPRAAMEQFIGAFRGEKFREEFAKMVGGITAPVEDTGRRDEIRSVMLSAPKHVAVGALEGMADESIWGEDQIRVPVLAVLAQSPFWPADTEQFFRRVAPDLDYRMWTGVSHFLMMDKPDEFNRELSGFLARRRLLAVRK